MTDSVPEKLGKYRIIEEVGRGGFAAVYKAVDTTLDRTVALKVLAPHLLWDPTFVQRFQREAKVAANLDHPHIVTIYEVGQIEGIYFIAMRFLEGRTLSQILETEGPLPVARAQAIIEQLASALDYAHARGLIHRDIKPSNIIVADDGRATLTDFGLVRAGEGTKLSTTGVVFGTPEYMSPEQAEGKALDARSDVYSLGVVLYEMLAGRAPFVADTTPAVMYKHVHEPPPLEELPSDLPQGVVAVARALEEAIEARVKVTSIPPESAAVLKEKQPTEPPAPKVVPKKALEVGAKVGGGLVLLFIVGTILLGIRSCGPTPTPAPPTDTSTPSVPPDMVYVPAGEFIMGSAKGQPDEQPVHTVYLDAFYIDKHEVTNAQFAQFLNEQGNQEEGGVTWLDIVDADCLITQRGGQYQPKSGYSDHPVIEVSWYGARAYCQWAGKRLLTEAEWEKAARGTDGRTYPWGEGIDCDHAQYRKCGGRTVPVGSKPKGASPYGALDMAGNVWEWVADWYNSGYYATSPGSTPKGPASGAYRVFRGGAWRNSEVGVRAAYRYWDTPDDTHGNLGFRCAR